MKQQLREKYKQLRKNIPNKTIQSSKIADKIRNHTSYQQSDHIAFYYSYGSEVDTKAMIQQALLDHKHVYLPKVINKEEMEFYEIKSLDEIIHRNALGILEPEASVRAEKIEVMIIPGLCFDEKGDRLGYGGGYYDRYLQDKEIYKIGICFDEQLSDEAIEINKYDIQMDEVITMKGNFRKENVIEEVEQGVAQLLAKDDSGHGMDHIEHVLELSLRFCEKEKADKEITALIAFSADCWQW